MKKIQVKCGSSQRRQQVKEKGLNGIDYLKVLPASSTHGPLILLYCLNSNNLSNITVNNIVIGGGVRIKMVKIEWVSQANTVTSDLNNNIQNEITSDLSSDEADELRRAFVPPDRNFSGNHISNIGSANDSNDKITHHNNSNSNTSSNSSNVLIIRPVNNGDFSTYTLSLISSPGSNSPPTGFDIILSSIEFKFNAQCVEDFDCMQKGSDCPQEVLQEPLIDYMAKDYSSFRKLTLDRLASIMPQWKERNPSDQGIMLVELLAYIGDHMSYHQDAVATEAYLGTARKRVSMKRHSRLLDYSVMQGCNARAWIHFSVDGEMGNNGILIPEKTKLLTGADKSSIIIQDESELDGQLSEAKTFQTMHEVTAYSAHNEIQLYTWSDTNCCLPKGATHATLNNLNSSLRLSVGDYLLFEEISSPDGVAADVNPKHRQVVRITEVERSEDQVNSTPVLEITWDPNDALHFSLCIDNDGEVVSIARGNIALADHGYTVSERLDLVTSSMKPRPKLSKKPLTFRRPFNRSSPASVSASESYGSGIDAGDSAGAGDDYGDAVPDIFIEEYTGNIECQDKFSTGENGQKWHPKTDLLSSNKFERSFVVEIENDGGTQIRFGDNILGMEPYAGTGDAEPHVFCATYRVGNGQDGNVGAESIRRIVKTDTFNPSAIVSLRNPLAAKGGRDRESIEEIRQYAPEAFRTQRRAVTEDDYEIVLKKHPEVQRARAEIRWTGSWHTVYVTIDRTKGEEVDGGFKNKMVTFLESYRLAGYDVEINSPIYVPLEIKMNINVDQSHLREDVRKVLIQEFSNSMLPDGRLGFFHPDNFTFGQQVFLSKIYERAMSVDGVSSVSVTRFGRLRRPGEDAIDSGVLEIESVEVARDDNDPNFPENGKIDFMVRGGR